MSNKTSRDVASALGIAQSTVSRAFTPGASISPELRDRIHAAAEAIGYRPNLLARGLVAGQSRLIGMVIAPQTNLLYPELVYELSRRLAERDRQLLLLPADDEDAAAEACERLRSYRVDAIVATGVIGEETARAIVSRGMPLVTFNRLIPGVAGVSCDFVAGAAALGRQLLAAGHRSFGFIGGPRGSWVSGAALHGFESVIGGTPATTLSSVHAAYSYDEAASALTRLEAKAGTLPSAILCVSDIVAAGCLDHLRYSGAEPALPAPSLVSFSTNGASRWAGYKLSGCLQPTSRMIEELARLVCSEMLDQKTSDHICIMPDLVT